MLTPRKSQRLLSIIMLAILLAGCTSETASPPVSTSLPPTSTHPPPTPTTLPTAAQVRTSTFEPADCPMAVYAGTKVECGYLIVPEDWSKPDGRKLRLAVAVVRSDNTNPKSDPLIYLEGWPGSGALQSIEFLNSILAGVSAERDLILFDQRGTGYSEPALSCPERQEAMLQAAADDLSNTDSEALLLQAWQSCRSRLEAEGIDLSMYTSAASAADVQALMQALGYPQYNLFGSSYGTRLALTVMRDHPRQLRSVVLDSVLPPNVDLFETVSANAQRSFDLLFERCAQDPDCNQEYPDLEAKFYALVDRLNNEPLPVNLQSATYQLRGDDLVYLIFNTFYNRDMIVQLPELLANFEAGDKLWLKMWLNYIMSIPIDWGMHNSVWCAEEIPFNTEQEFARINAGLNPDIVAGMLLDGNQFAVCEIWDVNSAGKVETESVTSDIPTLLLSGDYDPITPPAFAREAARTLSNAQVIEFLGHTHGVGFSSPCAQKIMRQFLDAPQEEIDTACLAELKITFYSD